MKGVVLAASQVDSWREVTIALKTLRGLIPVYDSYFVLAEHSSI